MCIRVSRWSLLSTCVTVILFELIQLIILPATDSNKVLSAAIIVTRLYKGPLKALNRLLIVVTRTLKPLIMLPSRCKWSLHVVVVHALHCHMRAHNRDVHQTNNHSRLVLTLRSDARDNQSVTVLS